MRLNRAYVAATALALVMGADLSAQVRPTRAQPRVNPNPRLLVATPHVFTPTDSAAAVRVGNGMRNRLVGQADRWFNVITREHMNEALELYAYPPDAVLPPMVARTLGTALQARMLVSSTMTRDPSGRYTIASRLIGMNDEAGHLVINVQQPAQSFEEFGVATANAMLPAFRALPDAKACFEQMATNQDRAVNEALKALRTLPDHGLASFCLGEIALARENDAEAITRFESATKGDSGSLAAWTKLAMLYHRGGDSARVVSTYQQMLRVAPTNQLLREDAFRIFLAYGKPDAALEVAEEGLAIDPGNAELWDLKSNACLYLENYPCAIDALEQVFSNDSTKADTTFFQKITFVASREPDTVRFLRWSRAGVRKYPDNPILLEQLIQAYGYAGPVDSVVAVTRRLVAIDNSDMTPVVRAVQALGNAGRNREMMELGAFIVQHGNNDDKQNYAGLLTTAIQPLVQQDPRDWPLIADMSRAALAHVPEGTQLWAPLNYFLGLAAFFQMAPLDAEADAQKSCEIAQRMQALLDEAGPALTAGRSAANEQYVSQLLSTVEQARPRVAQHIRNFCR